MGFNVKRGLAAAAGAGADISLMKIKENMETAKEKRLQELRSKEWDRQYNIERGDKLADQAHLEAEKDADYERTRKDKLDDDATRRQHELKLREMELEETGERTRGNKLIEEYRKASEHRDELMKGLDPELDRDKIAAIDKEWMKTNARFRLMSKGQVGDAIEATPEMADELRRAMQENDAGGLEEFKYLTGYDPKNYLKKLDDDDFMNFHLQQKQQQKGLIGGAMQQ